MTDMKKIYIKQDAESSALTIACRLISDDDPQIQLVPGEWVKVATCPPGNHQLRVGSILASGKQAVTLHLNGLTHNSNDKIEELFFSPTDGSLYDLEIQE